jgi:hypothetical protein
MRVVDRREIEFDAGALAHYLATLPREAQSLGLPLAPPAEIRFDPAQAMVEIIYVMPDQTVRIPAETLKSMLVSYCIRSKIPIPRIADHSIQVAPDRLILALSTSFGKPPPPAPTPRPAKAAKTWKRVEVGRVG